MIVVSAVTVYACELLMDQCTVTGQHDYERLAYAVGGKWWQASRRCMIYYIICLPHLKVTCSAPRLLCLWLLSALPIL